MLELTPILANELALNRQQVENALELLLEGATIPFIARYRKEKTESLDEMQLRNIWDRYNYLTELEKRKEVILESIASQNKLTDELKNKIENCVQKTELEDLYLPYKPKRRVTVQGGCQAASGIDFVEELSWGRREGGELPPLEA